MSEICGVGDGTVLWHTIIDTSNLSKVAITEWHIEFGILNLFSIMSSIEVNYHQKKRSFVDKMKECNRSLLQNDGSDDDGSERFDDVSMGSDKDNFHELCWNCRRSNQNLVLTTLTNSPFRLKYCFIENCQRNDEKKYLLCNECRNMLSSRELRKEKQNLWPSFVWSVLCSENHRTRRVMWKMLVQEWRSWWKDAVEGIGYTNDILNEPVRIDDMSDGRKKCVDVLSPGNLGRVGWKEFKKVVEDTLILPIVRCPFGCSEYVHRCGTFPFDVFVQQFVDHDLLTYSRRSTKNDCISFRMDLLDYECLLLEGGPENNSNKRLFKCMPSIEMVEDVPMILLCRYHHGNVNSIQ